MDIRTSVFKRKSKSDPAKRKSMWICRLTYFDEIAGKTKTEEKSFATGTLAKDFRDKRSVELRKTRGQIQTGEKMTFAALAAICAENIYCKAVIVEGRKIEGVRGLETAKNHLAVLTEYFGNRKIGFISNQALKDYRLWRLENGSRHPSAKEAKESGDFVPVKLATINREFSTMRRIMREAFNRKWILEMPDFSNVIDETAEEERTRRLGRDEETRLLAACQGERYRTYTRTRHGKDENITAKVVIDNPHLKAMVLLAIDSAMRRGEILKLRWEDIDFENNLITILGTHTKTLRARLVPLTTRVKDELERVRQFTPGERPFPFTDFKRSWATAKEIAGIKDLHFHDLRRTAITRWIEAGIPIEFAGKIAGHTQQQTTAKHYITADADVVREVAAATNAAHEQIAKAVRAESGFVN